jgi:hypothetical protein
LVDYQKVYALVWDLEGMEEGRKGVPQPREGVTEKPGGEGERVKGER